jgi:hypothetical protein
MNIPGIGCAARILHNALQTSANILPTDVKAIVNKIFQYLHTDTRTRARARAHTHTHTHTDVYGMGEGIETIL